MMLYAFLYGYSVVFKCDDHNNYTRNDVQIPIDNKLSTYCI